MKLLSPIYNHEVNIVALDGNKSALVYESAKHDPSNVQVGESYRLLRDGLLCQWEAVESQVEVTGYKNEEKAPYANSKDMLRDIEKSHLWYLKTSDNDAQHFLSGHPMLQKVTTKSLGEIYLNDLFRIVHDIYGHYVAQSSFSLNGEMLAWLEHRKMFPKAALPALWCETRGQASWTNCWGTNPLLPLKDRPFAIQKAAVIPRQYV